MVRSITAAIVALLVVTSGDGGDGTAEDDGAGFGQVAALLAVVGTVLVATRRACIRFGAGETFIIPNPAKVVSTRDVVTRDTPRAPRIRAFKADIWRKL